MKNYSPRRADQKTLPTKTCDCSSSDSADSSAQSSPQSSTHELAVSSSAVSPQTENVYLKGKKEGGSEKVGRCKIAPWYILPNFRRGTYKINDLREGYERARKLGYEKFLIQNSVKKFLPKHRTCNCLKQPFSNASGVTVHQSKEYKKCHYGNLFVCGRVWVCPVCGAKISEKRRQELTLLDERHGEVGEKLLVTLTFPHQYTDKLPVLLDRLKLAKRKMMQNHSFKKLWKEVGRIGWVQALEVTHGERNGWHPHIHELWLVDKSLEEQERIALLEDELYPLWRRFCIASDLPEPSKRHGVDVRDGTYASKYIAKWGIEEEMTKGHIKRGKQGNRTPWDFLRDIFLYDDDQAKILFREYVKAFKGKPQLRWSRGLKKLYNIEEKKDEQLAKEQIEESDMLGRIAYEDWKLILRYETRWNLLHVAQEGGWAAIQEVIEALRAYEAERKINPKCSDKT